MCYDMHCTTVAPINMVVSEDDDEDGIPAIHFATDKGITSEAYI
jgi:hypothetical protein